MPRFKGGHEGKCLASREDMRVVSSHLSVTLSETLSMLIHCRQSGQGNVGRDFCPRALAVDVD